MITSQMQLSVDSGLIMLMIGQIVAQGYYHLKLLITSIPFQYYLAKTADRTIIMYKVKGNKVESYRQTFFNSSIF